MFIEELLSKLSLSGLRYCVVGGVAINLHGIPRMTYDIDLVVIPEMVQLKSLAQLLDDMGLKCRLPIALTSLSDPIYRQQMRDERSLIAVTFTHPTDPLKEVDVLISPPIDPAGLIERAVIVDLNGTKICVASLPDLIEMKRISGRHQDLDDVAHLERILGDISND